MESELDLNDIIQEMHVIATMPDLYHLLVELNAVHSLLGLLSHENSDILFLKRCFGLLKNNTCVLLIEFKIDLNFIQRLPFLIPLCH